MVPIYSNVCTTSSLDYLEHCESLQDDCGVVSVAFIVSCHEIDKLCPLPGVWNVERQRCDGKITDTHQDDTQNAPQQHLDDIQTHNNCYSASPRLSLVTCSAKVVSFPVPCKLIPRSDCETIIGLFQGYPPMDGRPICLPYPGIAHCLIVVCSL